MTSSTKPIKCIGCGGIIYNEFNWKCEDCRQRDLMKKKCDYHEPSTNEYNTTCKRCNVNIVPRDWRVK